MRLSSTGSVYNYNNSVVSLSAATRPCPPCLVIRTHQCITITHAIVTATVMVIFLTLIRFNFVMTSNKNNLLVVVNSFKLNKDLKILRYSGLLIDVCLFSGALILKSCCSQSSIKCFLLLNNDFRLVISSNRKLCRMMKWSLMNTLHYKQLLFIIVGQMFNSDHG